MVTPTHKILRAFVDSRGQRDWRLTEADELVTRRSPTRLLAGARWIGPEPETLYAFGRHVEARALMRLAGYFVTEGHAQKRRRAAYEVHFSQLPGRVRNEMRATLTTLGFHAIESSGGSGLMVSSKALWLWAQEFGDGAERKRLPAALKAMGSGLLAETFEAMVDGDGTRYKGRARKFYTTSRQLADDFAEVALKTGHTVTIKKRANGSGPIKGKAVRARLPIYHVSISRETERLISPRHVSLRDDVDAVYCVTVPPHHTVYARRNGRAVWTGNSWHSWYAAMRPEHPGVPESMCDLAFDFAYNDVRSFHLALDVATARTKQLPAAIFVEPTLLDRPAEGFLKLLRDTATTIGAVLVFDEIVTGFRWHVGGYQALCGVTPDLATFGKAMGNGVPVAALVGKREVMEHAWLASGTHNGDTLGLAAALAVLDAYRDEDACTSIAQAGIAFGNAYRSAAADVGCKDALLLGQPQHPKVAFADDDDKRKITLFLAMMAERGVLLHPAGFNPSASHGDAELRLTEDALRVALGVVQGAIQRGDLATLVPAPIKSGWRPTA